MKTTIEIDQQLLRQAQKTLGTIPLDLTPVQLRSQRHKRPSHVSR